VTLELPRWLLAERLAFGLILAGALVTEVVLVRYPALRQGPGLLAAALLALWQWRLGRHRSRRVRLGPGDIEVQAGAVPTSATGPRARILGRSVVLHWRANGRSRTAWLTPADVPPAALRRMRVCCRTQRRPAVS
jgi:hypothetical protein